MTATRRRTDTGINMDVISRLHVSVIRQEDSATLNATQGTITLARNEQEQVARF